jgi:hypothetical protein
MKKKKSKKAKAKPRASKKISPASKMTKRKLSVRGKKERKRTMQDGPENTEQKTENVAQAEPTPAVEEKAAEPPAEPVVEPPAAEAAPAEAATAEPAPAEASEPAVAEPAKEA